MIIAKAAKLYSKLPEQRRAAGKVLTKYKASEAGIEAIEQAESFLRVKTKERLKDKKLAVTGYQSIVKNYPDSHVAQLAAERLAVLGAEVPAVPPSSDKPTDAAVRTWSSSDGKFKIRAVMVQANATHVQLKTEDGKLIAVPLKRLSSEDVEFVVEQGGG